MKILAFALLTLGLLFNSSAFAEEKKGLLVTTSNISLERNDSTRGVWDREIDRNMALKVAVKNTSFDDLPVGKVDYVLLVKRWAVESGTIERLAGSASVEALLRGKSTEIVLGNYKIGGHLHGTSRMHVDSLAGWKLTFRLGDKEVVFANTSQFDALEKKAKSQ